MNRKLFTSTNPLGASIDRVGRAICNHPRVIAVLAAVVLSLFIDLSLLGVRVSHLPVAVDGQFPLLVVASVTAFEADRLACRRPDASTDAVGMMYVVVAIAVLLITAAGALSYKP